MAYYERPLGLGDSDLGAIRLSAGAKRLSNPIPIPTRSGAVVGGVPKMSAVRRTMAAQGDVAPGVTAMMMASGIHTTAGARKVTKQLDREAKASTRRAMTAEMARPRPLPSGTMSYVDSATGQHLTKREFRAVNRAAPPQMPLAPAAPLINIINDAPPMPVEYDANGVGDYGVATRRLAHSRVLFGSGGSAPLIYGLGDDEGLGGFSLKGIVKGVSKAVKTVASPVQKAAAAVGHTAGNIVTSKVGQAVLGTALAATGVGIPAAAAIMGGTKAVGNLIKPGGNLKHAATGALQGAATGVVAGAAGQAFKAIAPNAQQSVSGAVKNLESKFVQAGKGLGKGAVKTVKGAEHVAETVVKGAVKGTGKVLGGVLHGAEAVGKKIIGIPGSFNPTGRDPNGDGINEDTGRPSDEASSAEAAGRAERGSRIPKEQRPRVGSPGQFPRSPRDPMGTGIDQTTGGLTPEAKGGIDRGAAVMPNELPPDAPPPPVYNPTPGPFGGFGGGGGAPAGGSGFDPGSLAAGAAAAAGGAEGGMMEAGMTGAGGLGGMLGNINPTMMLAGAAAFVFLPKLLGGGKPARSTSRSSGTRRRSSSRSRSRRR